MWSLNMEMAGRIQSKLESFINGEPQSFEQDLGPGVWFHMDCPFEEDLMEPTIPVSVGISTDSPLYDGESETLSSLMDYGEGFGDSISTDLGTVFSKAGCEIEYLEFTYSPNNSNPDDENGIIQFLGTIPNPRVEYDWLEGKYTVKEVYA